jgi:hypothetical protein
MGAATLFGRREDEGRLMHIVAALDRIFDRCEDTVRHTLTYPYAAAGFEARYADRLYKALFELVGCKPTTDNCRRLIKRCVMLIDPLLAAGS